MPAVVSAVTAPVFYTGRMALKLEQLLDELIQTVRVLRRLAASLDDGIIDDVVSGVQQLQDATELLTTATGQLERLTDVTGLVTSLPGVKHVKSRMTPRPKPAEDQLLFEA